MPLYSFVCQECQVQFEERRSFSRAAEIAFCPNCKTSNAKKLLSNIYFLTSRNANSLSSEGSMPVELSAGECGCSGCSCGQN